MFMNNAIKSESVVIAEAIANALGSRYYDTEVVGNSEETIICTHYNVYGAEWEFQNGTHTRYIRVFYGIVSDDVDDYFECPEDEEKFVEVEAAYARLCPPPVVMSEKAAELCPIDDEDIPF